MVVVVIVPGGGGGGGVTHQRPSDLSSSRVVEAKEGRTAPLLDSVTCSLVLMTSCSRPPLKLAHRSSPPPPPQT